MSNETLTTADWIIIFGFIWVVLALFVVLVLGLREIWRDEWRGERRRRGRSWCPRLSMWIERARVHTKIYRFLRDLEQHNRVARGGNRPGRHHLANI